jgi:hypothetical protein
MKNIILPILCLISLYSQAQSPQPLAVSNYNTLNVNDTSYLRIYNGIIVSNDYKIQDFERVNKISREDADQLGIHTSKPIMLVEYEENALESQIDSILYNRPDFISNYKFPLSIQLPIAINNKLLSHEEKRLAFQNLTIKDVKQVEYIDNKQWNLTAPFGAINIRL